jgi:hypothetical protein
MTFTIEYLAAPTSSGARAVKTAAMVFHDETAAIEGAYALLKSGIAVTKVAGPGVQIGPRALEVRVASIRRRNI